MSLYLTNEEMNNYQSQSDLEYDAYINRTSNQNLYNNNNIDDFGTSLGAGIDKYFNTGIDTPTAIPSSKDTGIQTEDKPNLGKIEDEVHHRLVSLSAQVINLTLYIV